MQLSSRLSRKSNSSSLRSFFLLPFLLLLHTTQAVFPTGEIEFQSTQGYTYCARADFGPGLPSKKHAQDLLLVQPPADADGCSPLTLPGWLPTSTPFALLLPRGTCSFETKALAAQEAGASLLIIYNNEEALYFNKTATIPKLDYECANGQAFLPTVAEPLWSPTNNPPTCAQDPHCASGRCLVTNTTTPEGTQVCCAWDVYMTMGQDPTVEQTTHLLLPTVYVTMRDGDAIKAALLATLAPTGASGLVLRAYERPRPTINISSILIWLLGCATVVLAAWNSSLIGVKKTGGGRRGGELMDGQQRMAAGAGEEEEEEEEEEELPALDLSVGHTVGFIVTASCFLVLLFYVDLNRVISGLYCLSAGSAVATIAARPLLKKCLLPRRFARLKVVEYRRWDISISLLDFFSTVLGLGMGVWWFVVRDTAPYAWVLQDIMGVCLCVLFLTLVRFPNIKVATVLLVLAFLYDIFFVFLSPIFFHESVMIKVATGGEPKADETYCEKYPTDKDCKVRDNLPMLLVLPRINDYAVGFTMLGLGDIILPGLLVAFAAGYDRAKGARLFWGQGSYFRLMVIGYAVGLMMANIAVYLMKMGQPALLYLVPCTLGVFSLYAYKQGVLTDMWKGPPCLNPPPRQLPSHHQGGGGEGGGERLPVVNAEPIHVASAPVLAVASPVEGGVRIQPQQQQQEDAPLLDL